MDKLFFDLNSLFDSLNELEKKSFLEFFNSNLLLFEKVLYVSRLTRSFNEVENA